MVVIALSEAVLGLLVAEFALLFLLLFRAFVLDDPVFGMDLAGIEELLAKTIPFLDGHSELPGDEARFIGETAIAHHVDEVEQLGERPLELEGHACGGFQEVAGVARIVGQTAHAGFPYATAPMAHIRPLQQECVPVMVPFSVARLVLTA